MKIKENNKGFGLLFFLVLIIISFWPLLNEGEPRIFILPFAVLFLILGLINSRLLTPLNKIWIKFGELLGTIIAPIVMGVVYFIILTPISLILRILRKDLLNLKFSNKVKSYWVKRIKDLGSMNKQF